MNWLLPETLELFCQNLEPTLSLHIYMVHGRVERKLDALNRPTCGTVPCRRAESIYGQGKRLFASCSAFSLHSFKSRNGHYSHRNFRQQLTDNHFILLRPLSEEDRETLIATKREKKNHPSSSWWSFAKFTIFCENSGYDLRLVYHCKQKWSRISHVLILCIMSRTPLESIGGSNISRRVSRGNQQIKSHMLWRSSY